MKKIRRKQLLMMIVLGLVFVSLCIIGRHYFLLITLVCVFYGLIEPYWIEYKETVFSSEKIPESFNHIKIVFVSDIHHSPVYPKRRLKALVKKINSLQPDLILLGGDYINEQKYVQSCFEEFIDLQAPLGVYAVLGNHDYRVGAKLVMDAMEKSGITCLNNKSVWLSKDQDTIKLGGVEDYWNGKPDIQPTIWDVQSKDFVILLSHNPDFTEEIQSKKVDLVICGHNHGGQGTIFGFWAPFITSKYGQKYRTGLVETAYTKVLVSNGVGNVGNLPIRFFARPQINIIHLIKK